MSSGIQLKLQVCRGSEIEDGRQSYSARPGKT